ncbi:MAG: hypothetical protein RLZZ596_626 [Pseudomonadota bacterium]
MKLQTQRWLDRWVGQVLCAAVSLWARLSGTSAADQQPIGAPRHILIILLSEMGSIVLAGPMFQALRQRYPSARLHVLQLKKNQQVARMLELTDEDCLHALDDSSAGVLLRDIWRFSLAMRRLPLDLVIDCELFSRISSLLSYISGASRRAGFTPHTQEGLYRGSHINCAVAYNPYQHISLQFLTLVDALQSDSVPRHKATPKRELPTETGLSMTFAPEELQRYRSQLLSAYPVLTGRKIALMYPGGGILPERAWPALHYAKVARGLCEAGHAVGLIGLQEDSVLAAEICNEVQDNACISLTGYTKSLRELLMLFHASHLLLTNDGGPGHFASLTPIRTLMFFGPETSRLYGPLPGPSGQRADVYESGIACSPCLSAYNHRQTFCDGDNQCLKRILPDPVLADALHILGKVHAEAGA